MKALLQLDFFLEDTGIKVELVSTDDSTERNQDTVQLRLRTDQKKRKTQYKENEAIQFDYNIAHDNPEEVAHEMVSRPPLRSSGYRDGAACC